MVIDYVQTNNEYVTKLISFHLSVFIECILNYTIIHMYKI
jgi:hypothetical protein